RHRAPAFLHLRTVRLLGHAGSDVESAYRTPTELRADLDRDPLVGTARVLVDSGVMGPQQVLDAYEAKRRQVRDLAAEVLDHPRLSTRRQVVAPLTEIHPDRARQDAATAAGPERRQQVFGSRPPEHEGPLTLAQSINRALADTLAHHQEALIFG